MSFLSGIYAKVLGTNSQKREETRSCTDTGNQFTEDFDNEDGFVLYSVDQQYKRCKQTEHSQTGGITSCERLQQSCPYPPVSGSILNSVAPPGRNLYQKKDLTFLTVSDVPMQLSKHLQTVVKNNQGVYDRQRMSSSLNMEQYNYDFSLEKTVLSSLHS